MPHEDEPARTADWMLALDPGDRAWFEENAPEVAESGLTWPEAAIVLEILSQQNPAYAEMALEIRQTGSLALPDGEDGSPALSAAASGVFASRADTGPENGETAPETGPEEAEWVLEPIEEPLPLEEPPEGDGKSPDYRLRSRIALALAAVLLAAACLASGTVWSMYQKGTSYDPSPNQEDAAAAKPTAADPYADFPEVDWGHWQGVNPDIIGWVTVPGTSIDYPIVQERAEAVGFYLNHDAYGDWNYTGVPYLDWECAEKGLDSPNCPIAGHHMQGAEAMFAELVHYNDAGWAKEHREVWIQTPDWKKRLYVQAAGLVPGWEASMVTSFKDRSEWVAWWKVRYEAADVKLSKTARLRQPVYSLYTCSYFVWSSNERTLVYAMEVK